MLTEGQNDGIITTSKEEIDAAHRIVADLCEAKVRWVMSVPANEKRDPYLIISKALNTASNLVSIIEDIKELMPDLTIAVCGRSKTGNAPK